MEEPNTPEPRRRSPREEAQKPEAKTRPATLADLTAKSLPPARPGPPEAAAGRPAAASARPREADPADARPPRPAAPADPPKPRPPAETKPRAATQPAAAAPPPAKASPAKAPPPVPAKTAAAAAPPPVAQKPAERTQLVAADPHALEQAQRQLAVGPAKPRPASSAPLSADALTSPKLEEADRRDVLWYVSATLSRLTAVAWIAGAVVLWAQMIGYGHTDIVPELHDPRGPWLTTMTASLVFPVVAVGLWLLGRWGLVVWAAAIVAGGVVFSWRPELVPFGPLALAANLAAAVIVAALGTVRAIKTLRTAE